MTRDYCVADLMQEVQDTGVSLYVTASPTGKLRLRYRCHAGEFVPELRSRVRAERSTIALILASGGLGGALPYHRSEYDHAQGSPVCERGEFWLVGAQPDRSITDLSERVRLLRRAVETWHSRDRRPDYAPRRVVDGGEMAFAPNYAAAQKDADRRTATAREWADLLRGKEIWIESFMTEWEAKRTAEDFALIGGLLVGVLWFGELVSMPTARLDAGQVAAIEGLHRDWLARARGEADHVCEVLTTRAMEAARRRALLAAELDRRCAERERLLDEAQERRDAEARRLLEAWKVGQPVRSELIEKCGLCGALGRYGERHRCARARR